MVGRFLPVSEEDQEPGRTPTDPETDTAARHAETPAPRAADAVERRTETRG